MPTPLQWAHLALDGGLFRLDTPNDDLGPIRDEVAVQLSAKFPCLGATPETTLTGIALSAYQKWLGYATAITYLEFGGAKTPEPVAGEFGLVKLEVKSGDVVERFGRDAGRDYSEDLPKWRKIITSAQREIPCIAQALPVKRTLSLFNLGGASGCCEEKPRRTRGFKC